MLGNREGPWRRLPSISPTLCSCWAARLEGAQGWDARKHSSSHPADLSFDACC